MKYSAFAIIGLVTLITGVACFMPGLQPIEASMAMSDTELRWREVSGPNGERNPAALPLYKAIFARDRQEVAALLDRGASPDALLYPGGWSPLMLAIDYNDSEIVHLLVKHGANLNYVSDDPVTGTPLVAALNSGRLYTIEHPDVSLADHLLDSGVDVGHPDFSIFYYLLDSGADINVEFRSEDVAIYAVVLGQIKMLNVLLARGYHRDLRKLKKYLEIGHYNNEMQPEKDKALATVDRLLAEMK